MSAGHDNNWMPLYVGDYLRDTTRLTVAEHGAYLLLIMDYWVNGPPPDDDHELARIARTPLSTWRQYRRGTLMKLFDARGGRWFHKRIEAELVRAHQLNEKKRRGGLASARVRRTRNGTAQPEHRSEDSTQRVRVSVRAPLPCKEEGLAPKKANPVSLTTREPSPPLPSQGDGVAAPRVANPETPTVFDDPAPKAEVIDTLERCKDALRGKRQVLDADGTVTPPDPIVVAFQLRLVRLNALAGERLSGTARLHAWEVIAAADAIGDPAALPPVMVADLAAIESLSPYAEAAE